MRINLIFISVVFFATTIISAASVQIDPTVVQNMGVRVQKAHLGDVYREIRALGSIEVAETNIAVINLKYSGWIKKLHVSQTGQMVKNGDILFSIHSPELIMAQDEFILAQRNKNKSLLESAKERLSFLGLSKKEISNLRKQKSAPDTIFVRSPLDGFVLLKSVDEGAKINAGTDLFKIGDLKKVWVNASVYEFDAPYVQVGAEAQMELSYIKGHLYQGRVAFVHPSLDKKTRTLQVRLEFNNPQLFLRPNMFAKVHIKSQVQKNVLAIPNKAIIHSGPKSIVFIAKKMGHYEPRIIKMGLTGSNDYSEVISGLKIGDLVVTSGQFMLDSESQMQEAIQKMLATNLHSSANHTNIKQKKPPKIVEYWTCPMHPEIIKDKAGSCPICHMNLVKKKRVIKDSTSSKKNEHKNNIFYTCPMHPHVISKNPGTCPICKMDLVKKSK